MSASTLGWTVTASLTGYMLVWFVYGWRLSVYFIDRQQRDNPRFVNRGDLMMNGIFVALLWPVTMPVRAVYRLLTGSRLMRTPWEREQAERLELERLRRQARELGLPMGDE